MYLDGGESPLGVASTIVDATGPVLKVVRDGGIGWDELIAAVGLEAFDGGEETE